MRNIGIYALAAASFSALAAEISRSSIEGVAPVFGTRRGKGQATRRGKGKLAKPRKRPNRLTVSKRVRRKHRRAA